MNLPLNWQDINKYYLPFRYHLIWSSFNWSYSSNKVKNKSKRKAIRSHSTGSAKWGNSRLKRLQQNWLKGFRTTVNLIKQKDFSKPYNWGTTFVHTKFSAGNSTKLRRRLQITGGKWPETVTCGKYIMAGKQSLVQAVFLSIFSIT